MATQALLAETSARNDFRIAEVEIVRVRGTYAWPVSQHVAQAVHIYPSQRPQPFRYNPDQTMWDPSPLTHHYVRIRTESGLEGFYGYIDPECVWALRYQLRPFLIGKDAMQIEALWDQLYRRNRHARAGHYMMALSAVDNALWDLRGKALGVPVYQLLGGPTREEVRVYGSTLGESVEPGLAGPKAKQFADQGFQHQKWFLAYGPGDGPAGLRRNIELVEELRDAVGPDVQLMFDAYMSWDLPFAKAWVEAVAQYQPYWIEEAFLPAQLDHFVELSRACPFNVATGEHFYNRWEVQTFLRAGAIQIVQADPEWCGGVSELVKICHLASAYGAKVFPHGHNIHSALHVVASQSPDVCPLGEFLMTYMPSKVHFQQNPLLTSNGILQLPTAPGFGIELDDAKVESMDVLAG